MKKILFLITALIVVSCNDNVKEDYAIISGRISNKQAGDFSVNSEDGTFKEIIQVNPDGTFTDTLSTDIKSYVLYDGFNPIFIKVQPGDNLSINYDAKAFDNSISISGIGSEINNYLIEKRKAEKAIAVDMQKIYMLNEAQFKTSMLTFKEAQEKNLKNTKNLPNDFVKKESKNINYSYLSRLNSYERTHKYFTGNTDFKISDNFLDELKTINYANTEDFEFSNEYKGLVTDYYGKKAGELVAFDGTPFDMAFIKTVSAIKDEKIKNTLLFEFANFNLNNAKDVDAFYKAFTENSTNEKNNAAILEKYNLKTGLNKGKPSPKFVNYDNYKGGKTSLDDLKGKYLYIDIWATWCRPCLNEIPALKNLEKQFHGKNIEFVSISIDQASDYEKWKNMIKEKELTGIQLFATPNEMSFIENYQVEGIPRFIIIDAQGNIVNSNAPRPSDGNLANLLNRLDI